MKTADVRKLVRLLSTNPGVQFASFLYKTVTDARGYGGVVQHVTLILGASTENLYEKDVAILEALVPTLKGTEKEVAEELLASRRESLSKGIGNNSAYTQANTWWIPKRLRGTGLRVHRQDGHWQITALVHNRIVIDPGNPKPDTRRPRTIIKDKIESRLPSRRFRTYRLDHIAGIRVRGETVEFDNVI